MARHLETRIRRVIDHIHDHPDGDLSLDALADVAAMSRFQWHRVFRALTGETAAQAVRRIRLHIAGIRLVRETEPVAAIARAVGYADAASFSRAFADAYGMPPVAFRQQGMIRPLHFNPDRKDTPMPDVTLRDAPEMRLAAVPHQGAYHEISRAFGHLFATLAARDLLPRVAGPMVGVYLDDPSATPAADLRSFAGVPVGEDVSLEAPLQEHRLPAGRRAVLVHQGPYAGLPAAYDALYGQWLPASGETPADPPSYEVYLNSPMDTPQDQLLTEITVPLR